MAENLVLYLKSFEYFLRQGEFDKAKLLVNRENAHLRDEYGDGVLASFCAYGPDDPGLFRYFKKLGATLELDSAGKRYSLLHLSVDSRRYRLMRTLLDMGMPVDILDDYGSSTLCDILRSHDEEDEDEIECMKMLLDAGADLSIAENRPFSIPSWVYDFVAKRKQTRTEALIILGLLRCKSQIIGQNGKDVLRIIARCTWGLRGL